MGMNRDHNLYILQIFANVLTILGCLRTKVKGISLSDKETLKPTAHQSGLQKQPKSFKSQVRGH